jgi:exosortase A-associated hydrolase 1
MPGTHPGHIGRPRPMNETRWNETACLFDCEGDRLVGIIARPEHPISTGLVIVVGGPQYRAGSHRQFTLLARQLAEHGIPSIRFDYRGMGDSEGRQRDFEQIDADIRAAIDMLTSRIPLLENIILWGLCDAATAALLHAHQEPRIKGLVLLNPWTESKVADAQARLRFYYPARLVSPEFWLKLFKLRINPVQSGREILRFFRTKSTRFDNGPAGFTEQMLDSLCHFTGEVLIVLADQDHTAQKFMSLCANNPRWRAANERPNVSTQVLIGANHTFSTREWRDQVSKWTNDWISSRLLKTGRNVP